MAAGSNNIVTDGLVACFDAANKRSYPGTGTTWTDLAGGYNGTLENGGDGSLTFDSANGGSLVFDGSDDVITTTANTDYGTGPFTAAFWVNLATVGASAEHVFAVSGWDWDSNFSIAYYRSDMAVYYGGSSPAIFSPAPEPAIAADTWYYFAFTRSGTVAEIYLDGDLLATGSLSASRSVASKVILLGAQGRPGGALGHAFEGKMASALFYKKALTLAEVLQNYNATKGRFI